MNNQLITDYLAQWGSPLKALRAKQPSLVRAALASGMDAEDIEQLAMIGLLEAAERFDPSLGASYSTYATYRMLGSVSHQLRREPAKRKAMKAGIQTISGDEALSEVYIYDPPPREDYPMLRYAIRQLTPRQRQVLDMRFGSSMTLRECGRVIGKTQERVRQIEEEAVAKLRRVLRGKCDEYR